MTQIKKYKKKPITIEACIYDGSVFSSDFIINWTKDSWTVTIFKAEINHPISTYLVIKTLDRDHIVSIGDYVIKGIEGEFYPCKPSVFKVSYNRVKAI